MPAYTGEAVASSTRDAVRPPTRVEAPAVTLHSVTRVFGITPALIRVDLSVQRGEAVLVRGPNGAGKSTLLRVIATVISPTYGGGTVLGHDLVEGRDAIRARTELMGHRTRLYDDLTAIENLRFAARLHGLDPGDGASALERVGLAGVARERVRGFSHGMRQRLALARVVLRSPDLLLLDDPYAGLDAPARELVDRELTRAREEGRTVILTAHEPAAEAVASRVVTMDAGRVLGSQVGGGTL
jgi:ABC-type multidrug transport system ATPase subunit